MISDIVLSEILERAFPGCHVASCQALEGGISARAVAVSLILHDGAERRVVVRRPSCASKTHAARVVQNEFDLLTRCSRLGIACPKPCFVDTAAGALGLLYVEGTPLFTPDACAPMLQQMAAVLAQIHAAPVASFDFLDHRAARAQRQIAEPPVALDATLDEPRLRSVLSRLWPFERYNADVLMHGDFWPGNLLWQGGELCAVLDWEEAEIGDPLADVALARLDIWWAFGEAAMHAFTDYYRAQTRLDWRSLACWDLCVALRPMSVIERWASVYPKPPICRPDITAESMRRVHREFVAQALRSVG